MKKRLYSAKGVALRIITLVAVVSLAACSSNDDTNAQANPEVNPDEQPQSSQTQVTYAVDLESSQEVPPVAGGAASGNASITLDSANGALSGQLTVVNLSGPAVAAHIHSGFAGNNGAVLFPLTASDDGLTFSVPADTELTADQQSQFLNGGMYLNVHTADNPGGEIRGQIIPAGIDVIRSSLSGDQEVPPVNTTGSAQGVLTVNRTTGAIWATVVTDLPEAATMAHIHQGAARTNGAVVIGLTQDAENPDTWRSAEGDTLGEDSLAVIDTAGLYFNVHTASNPGGEVRGQIGGTRFTVRIDNVSNSDTLPTSQGSVAVPLSPGAYIIHQAARNPLLDPRAPAGAALEALAEDGDPSGLPDEVPGSVVFNTPVGSSAPGPLLPGGYYVFSFIAAPGDKLALATMFVQSNDWFYSTTDADDDSISLFAADGQAVTGDVTDQLSLWETETELDEEPGTGINQAPRQSGPNTGTDEVGTVGSLASKGKSVTLNGPVIRVTLTVN